VTGYANHLQNFNSFSHFLYQYDIPSVQDEKLGRLNMLSGTNYRGADKSLARLGRKQTTTTEDFEFHISYL